MSLVSSLLPEDATIEEMLFLQEVKRHMLMKLPSDRTRFVFLYVIELGHQQREAARALGVHETEIARQMRYIREKLEPFKEGYDL